MLPMLWNCIKFIIFIRACTNSMKLRKILLSSFATLVGVKNQQESVEKWVWFADVTIQPSSIWPPLISVWQLNDFIVNVVKELPSFRLVWAAQSLRRQLWPHQAASCSSTGAWSSDSASSPPFVSSTYEAHDVAVHFQIHVTLSSTLRVLITCYFKVFFTFSIINSLTFRMHLFQMSVFSFHLLMLMICLWFQWLSKHFWKFASYTNKPTAQLFIHCVNATTSHFWPASDALCYTTHTRLGLTLLICCKCLKTL